MPHPTREIRLQIMLSKDELELIDNWRFMNRMPTRAAAFRNLLRRGLAIEHEESSPSHISEYNGVCTPH